MRESQEATLKDQLHKPYISEKSARLTKGKVIKGKITEEPVRRRFIKKLYLIERILRVGMIPRQYYGSVYRSHYKQEEIENH